MGLHHVFWTAAHGSVWGVPCPFGPDSSVEPGVDAHVRGSPLLHSEFPDFLECPRAMLLETHSIGALVNVDSISSGHHLVDGGPPFVGVFR